MVDRAVPVKSQERLYKLATLADGFDIRSLPILKLIVSVKHATVESRSAFHWLIMGAHRARESHAYFKTGSTITKDMGIWVK
jgi:hypothetical protein